VNILRHWRKKIEEETQKSIQEARQAARTGDERLAEVRELTAKGAEIRKESKQLRQVNRFVETFLMALEKGRRA